MSLADSVLRFINNPSFSSRMDINERLGWTKIITPDDLDKHMAEIGQAEANAHLATQMFRDFPLEEKASLLIPGCGTGQMFDYLTQVEVNQISKYNYTFTDFRREFLERLKQRLAQNLPIRYTCLEDDIEKTRLQGEYDGILLVLVLQHVEWEKALTSMLGLNPSRFYIIEQFNKGGGSPITKERKLQPTMKEYAETVKNTACLVNIRELTYYLSERHYGLLRTYEREVSDNKKMVGLVFEHR